MVNFLELQRDISEEISTILASNFSIDVVKTNYVPHSDDRSITFPNLDKKIQGTKFIETTVLYVDMRRSTELSMKHRRHTVAKLYSAFVRGMTRCAAAFDGEVRGIIGDRVMILFNSENCFENAVDTAILINSVCQYILNRHFTHNEVKFGIGIDYGTMLATKTGIAKRGSAQQSYKSLVWLGRPANIASKLTDNANKPAKYSQILKLKVAYKNGLGGFNYVEEFPHLFTQNFYFNTQTGVMHHTNPNFHSFTSFYKNCELQKTTPPILMTQNVYKGFCSARPNAIEITQGWFNLVDIDIPEYSDKIYGGDVIYTAFRDN